MFSHYMLYYKGENLTEGGNFVENKKPTMLTIREIARTGLLSEHALRLLLKDGKLPVIYVGKKALVNFDRLCDQLAALGKGNFEN